MEPNRQLEFSDERKDFKKYLAFIEANRHPISLLLDGIHDLQNIGMLFRLGDAARIEKIYFYPTSFDLNEKKLNRIARSTLQYIPHETLNTLESVKKLQQSHHLVALDRTNKSIPYTQLAPQKKILLIAGSEQYGVSDELLALADTTIHIPMYGVNTSMNVACATSIALFSIISKHFDH
ncbi:MAG: TrmH family RNA methyltransferase [Saprospiraceae bacterium]